MNLAIPKEGQSLCLKVRKELGERAQILKESLSDKIFSILDQDIIKNLDEPAWFQQGTRLFYTFNDL